MVRVPREGLAVIVLKVLGPTLIGLGVIAAIWYTARHRSPAAEGGTVVRRLFQYGLLLSLLIIVGSGVSGLLALVIPGDPVIARAGHSVVARWLAFIIVGGPALFAVARWVRRTLDAPGERTSPAWTFYLNTATLVGLFLGAVGAGDLALGILGVEDFDPRSPARLVVWGAVWFIHYRIAERYGHAGRLRLGVLVGALTGLLVLTGGIGWGLARLLERIYEAASRPTLVSDLGDELLRALVGMVIGGAIWTRYWLSVGLRLGRDVLWNGYVVLVGVLVGLVTALTAVGLLVASVLDWFMGDGSAPAAVHFAEAPDSLALLIVSGAVWAYHRDLVRSGPPAPRTEVDRVHDYAAAGAGLLATVSGVVAVIAAVIQAFVPAGITSPGDRSTLVNALTLLLVGVPVWWRYWSVVQCHRSAEPEPELRSPTRRIYLLTLFGLGGISVLASLLNLTFVVLTRLLDSDLGASTLYAVRIQLGLILAVGAVAGYHWAIRRHDRAESPAESGLVVRSVLLLGSGGREVAKVVKEQTGVKVRVWDRPDAGAALSTEAVMEAIESAEHPHLLILARPDGPEVIPYTE